MIEAVNLTKRFGSQTALDHISCTIPSGCIYGLVGSNGAGKSTFLRVLDGIYRADEGKLLIDGQQVYENPEVKAKIGFVPDDWYYPSGAGMNRMADMYERIYPGFDRKRFQDLTEAFRLDPKKPLAAFSKGMRRQAAIILVMACRPEYLVLDETFDGLDPIMRSVVKSLIMQDVSGRNTTAILTSHSLRELEDTCDQLALLHRGGIVLQSDIMNLKTKLFKIQIAFAEDFSKEDFAAIDVVHFSKQGSVANMIVRGDREAAETMLRSRNPLLLDILPLSLEEVFSYELEALGYSFDPALLADGKEEEHA